MQPSTSTLPTAAVPTLIPHVLLAEDDLNLRRLISMGLRREGYSVVEAVDGREVLEVLANRSLGRCALVGAIMDVRMPGHSGLMILRALAHARDRLPVVMMTAFGDEPTHRRAREYGARDVLDKPVTMGALCAAANDNFRGPVPAASASGRNDARTPMLASDSLLLDRYLDVLNRAVSLRRSTPRFGLIAKQPRGQIAVRIFSDDGRVPTVFQVRHEMGSYERVVGRLEEDACLLVETTREHLEDAIENPWVFYARPERFALWF